MQATPAPLTYVPIRSPTPPLGSSTEDLDELRLEVEELEKLDGDAKKPHFLDYDSIPPPGFDDHCIAITPGQVTGIIKHPGETIKVDKIYEKDGEVSDFEFAATTERQIHRNEKLSVEKDLAATYFGMDEASGGARKKKHFLDENPIPPDYDYEREHFSLDRACDRTSRDFESIKFERKHSLDRGRPKKVKEPSYALSRFLQTDDSPTFRGTWPADKPHDAQDSGNSIPLGDIASLNPKVANMYSLLSLLGCNNNSLEISTKFLELSKSAETCATLRNSGCIPLLVQKIHAPETDEVTKKYAFMALHNVVNCHPDDKVGRREAKVLRHIQQIIEYSNALRTILSNGESRADDSDQHPLQAMFSLMKVSFDEEHRNAMCTLGALQAIATVVQYDHAVHGAELKDDNCILLRRYAGMALTNLTFGHDNNKKLLCENKDFMKALVGHIETSGDDLVQVTANVLRNLSWHANSNMKAVLKDIGAVTALTKAAMSNKNENTVRAILSALWNLSAHSSNNKAEFCHVEGSLSFLVDMLTFKAPSKTSTIIENAGGILHNVSSYIACNEEFRKILRQKNCLGILLQQLKSESLTVVNNACGTLWNLSARCAEDQQFLWDNGAVPMLRSLIHSKHEMISKGSNAALRNLTNFKPGELNHNHLDSVAKMMNLKALPSLNMRKQKALQQELDQNLAETCDNLDAVTPPKEDKSLSEFIGSANGSYQTRQSEPTSARACHSAGDSRIDTQNSALTADGSIRPERRAHSAGAVKKLSAKPNSSEMPRSSKYQETDLDQITDFSLLYAENQNDSSDIEEVKPKGRWDAYGNELLIDDTVKCYETEGTPYTMSGAASVSDLRTSKAISNDMPNKSIKGGHLTIENSGINTPEKPIKYCEEGTPGYISVHNSFSSLEEEGAVQLTSDAAGARDGVADNTDDQIEHQSSAVSYNESPEHADTNVSGNDFATMPTTPGGTVSKAVTFTEFLETPLMFSRRSSMESLSSIEPNLGDDKSSVVSEISRMSSGNISPSELPDSPSQTIPQSPRHIRTGINLHNHSGGRMRSVFEDEVNTFGVENTPAHFSCATSLSNLSLDDEPKITTDCLLKEMRLMNHPSDDLDEVALDGGATNYVAISNDSMPNSNHNLEEDDAELSDSDEKDSSLLDQCISIGINNGTRSQNVGPVPPLLPRKVPRDNGHADPCDDCSSSDGSDIANDLLKQCIEDGIARSTQYEATDSQINHTGVPDDCCSTDGSVISNDDTLLKQCMEAGITQSTKMPKSQAAHGGADTANGPTLPQQIVKENPIGMLRQGGSMLPQMDEINRFHQNEDSPRTFSVMSALSDLTVGSNVAGLVNPNRLRNEPMPLNYSNEICADSYPQAQQSILSEADVNSFVDEPSEATVIGPPIPPRKPQLPASAFPSASTSSKPTTMPISLAPALHQISGCQETNDSLDSIDSNDERHEELLQQCIELGMSRAIHKNSTTSMANSATKTKQQSPKRSHLPILRNTIPIEPDRLSEKNSLDDELLLECINTGIGKNVRSGSFEPIVRQSRSILTPTNQQDISTIRTSSVGPKNEEATSVAVLVTMPAASAPNMAPGVEKVTAENTNALGTVHHQPHVAKSQLAIYSQINHKSTDIKPTATTRTGYNGHGEAMNIVINNGLAMSYGNMNNSCESNVLDHSNEYPASNISQTDYNDLSINESSIDMDVSNEFMVESFDDVSSQLIDKHKDPDLMLRSVERLTQDFVSTAEYLRTSASQRDDSVCDDKRSEAGGNNTWNEDSSANDVSYPSISMTAPIIASVNDDSSCSNTSNIIRYEPMIVVQEEETPTNEYKSFVISQNHNVNGAPEYESIDGETLKYDDQMQPAALHGNATSPVDIIDGNSTSVGGRINFRVGGEVQQPFRDNTSNYLSSGPYSVDTYSTMTNSTIIAMEAKKLRTDLLNMTAMTDSMLSLDLDHIRPPSVMDNVSISGYLEAPHSPQLSRMRKKSLPQGIMARRALTHSNPNGSLESVNSSCNLDNIKPPSLMDELLDSMISVDSITSEVVEGHQIVLQNGDETSNYETANSEYDDTTTLQSCMDLPNDNTPIPSDFSSAESTPRKSEKKQAAVLTPVQKRQANKDRYRTYTIPGELQAKANHGECSLSLAENEANHDSEEPISDEMIQVEVEEVAPKRLTPRQRRQEDRSRFQTQVLDSEMIAKSSSSVESSPRTPRRSRDNPRFLTRTISNDESESHRRALLQDTAVQNPVESSRKVRAHSQDFLLNEDSDSMSLVSNEEDMSSIRALIQPFKHLRDLRVTKLPTISNGSTEQINGAGRTEPRTTESNLNSMEFEQNSETESYDQNHDVDDETYIIQKPKPRIVKPGDRDRSLDSGHSDGSSNSPDAKAIRGRKKAAYVSPYKMTNAEKPSPKDQNGIGKISPKTTSDASKVSSANQPQSNVVVKSSSILSKTNIANKINSVKMGLSKPGFATKLARKNVIAEKNVSNQPINITQTGKDKHVSATTSAKPTSPEPASANQMPDRQGTFIKDKAENSDAPIVYSEPSSPIKTPTQSKIPFGKSTSASGKTSFISKLRSPLQRSATTNQPVFALSTAPKRNSVIGGVHKSPSTPYVSQRSNSNSSIKSNTSSASSTPTTKQVFSSQPPSRSNSNISSRIAGLWKRSNSDARKTSPLTRSPNRSVTNVSAMSRPPSGSKTKPIETPPTASKIVKTPSKAVIAKPITSKATSKILNGRQK